MGEKQSSTSMEEEEEEEEDFIDIDFASSSPEFEFHMAADDDPPLPSPADELFYKGKLLPLHLPPRLQMVEQLLRNTSAAAAAATPYHSCNAGGELDPKKSWTKKLKEATLSLKVKALFHGSRPSHEKLEASKATRRRQNPILAEDESRGKPSASPNPSSYSSGKSTPGRSSSASARSDAESSIQGAIAYCKKSSQWAVDSAARKSTSSSAGFYLLSASRIAPDCEQAEPLPLPLPPLPPPPPSNFCDAYLLLEHKSNAIKDFILAVSVNE